MRVDTSDKDSANVYTEIDNEARASYTYYEPFGREVAKTEKFSDRENRDYDKEGKLVGIERFW